MKCFMTMQPFFPASIILIFAKVSNKAAELRRTASFEFLFLSRNKSMKTKIEEEYKRARLCTSSLKVQKNENFFGLDFEF